MSSKIESLPSDLEYFKIVYPRKYMKIMLEGRSLWLQTNPFSLLVTSIYDNYSNWDHNGLAGSFTHKTTEVKNARKGAA